MKALIISEDKNFISDCSKFFNENNYDTIVYKWLLKAIDNIEEIQPNVIVISSSEYPRHWKTLVQFVKSGIGGDSVQIYLYEPTPLSNEDEEKSKVLGITNYFNSIEELNDIFNGDEVPSVENIFLQNESNTEVEQQVELPKENIVGHIMLTHPKTNSFITGKVTSNINNELICNLDFETDLQIDTIFSKATFIWDNEIKSFKAILKTVNDDKKEISLLVTNYYEKI